MPVLLAITPHPDDEAYAFGGTIALAARAGWKCFVECATAGERGKRHDGGPVGVENVGGARRTELAASCRAIGAEPPRVWGLPDGDLAKEPGQHERISALFSQLRPGIVLALGADGAYGHPDHIAVHSWVTEAWLAIPAVRPALLFAAFERGLFLPQYERCLGMMGTPPRPPRHAIGGQPVHYRVDISSVANEKMAAISAHRSQLQGGDPHAIFPGEIIQRLLTFECFTDATGRTQGGSMQLLADLLG